MESILEQPRWYLSGFRVKPSNCPDPQGSSALIMHLQQVFKASPADGETVNQHPRVPFYKFGKPLWRELLFGIIRV